jgi:hypothetical protein
MTTFKRERSGRVDPDPVLAWRVQRLRVAGLPFAIADLIARDKPV